MKKSYETAQMDIILFAVKEVIVASGVASGDEFVPNYTLGDNETEVLF